MILTDDMLKDKYKDYSNVHGKIAREIKNGNLIRIVKGLYETDAKTPNYLLASSICNPSYLSFEFALSYYGLIPEAVYNPTSATYKKRKRKFYHTPFGTYFFQDVPEESFRWGQKILSEGDYACFIATPEKALCDKVYTLKPVKNFREMEILLFYDLRIDEEEFLKLNINDLEFLATKYGSNNVRMLYKFARRYKGE